MGQAEREEIEPDMARTGSRNPYLAGYSQERKNRGAQASGGKKAAGRGGRIDMIYGIDIRAQMNGDAGKVTPYDRSRRGGADTAGSAVRRERAESPAVRRERAESPAVRRERAGSPAVRRERAGSPAVRRAGAGSPAARRQSPGGSLESAVRYRPQAQGTGRGRAAALPARPFALEPEGRSRVVSERRVREDEKRRALEQRRREVIHKRIAIGILEAVIVICMGLLLLLRMEKPKEVSAPPLTEQEEAEPQEGSGETVQGISAEAYARHPAWTEDFLTPNDYSRPGDPLGKVTNLFVHYTANPGTSAAQNRSYFEQLKDTHERGASAHFIIGYEGEIIQCVPLDEIAYAVQTRNQDSISIECCYKADNGSFTQETYDSLIALLSWLTQTYGLDEQDILRHYDCGGKKCPIYYTENEDAWERLKKDVKNYEA